MLETSIRYTAVTAEEYSVAHLYEQQATFIDICQELSSAGLMYAGNFDQVHGSNGEVIFLDAVFVRLATKPTRKVD